MASTRGITLKGRGDEREADWMRKVGYEDIGYKAKYESMVFRAGASCTSAECGCGLPTASDWSELDGRRYNSRREAQEGHYAFCWKWAAIGKDDAPPSDE